jgi:D-alanine-D-alanine ligase-like ATP-grasp enzyme
MTLDHAPQKSNSFLFTVMQQVAHELGATLEMLAWSVTGALVFSDGIRVVFERNQNDFVGAGTTKICRNKDITNALLEKHKVCIPMTRRARLESYHDDIMLFRKAILDMAEQIQYPVFVKPNDAGMGKGVHRLENKDELETVLTDFFLAHYPDILVQPVVAGIDMRVIVFRGKIFGAMIREPLSVVGDGVSTIESLLTEKRRVKKMKETHNDRIIKKIAKSGYVLSDVLAQDEKIYLLDNANISSGGTPIECADVLHDSYKQEVLRVAHILGVEFGGVDVLIDGDYAKQGATMTVLEVNAPCGLSGYASISDVQAERVKNMYIEMFGLIYKRKKVN